MVYNVHPLICLPIWALFLLIDGSYLSANLFKFLNGAHSPTPTLACCVYMKSDMLSCEGELCIEKAWLCACLATVVALSWM